MYAPCARSSLASVRSTRLRRDVTFFALSRGTVCPQLVHWTTPDDPLPPFLRPLLALFSGILYGAAAARPLILCMACLRELGSCPQDVAHPPLPLSAVQAPGLDSQPCPAPAALAAARRTRPHCARRANAGSRCATIGPFGAPHLHRGGLWADSACAGRVPRNGRLCRPGRPCRPSPRTPHSRRRRGP